ncbi:hypothetical protein ABZ646_09725 [Streptomyces sp. NPDC007162]|uniref:hypothetical protein n=1 Tax=Streptomyces sp. NPDC007162 TaxID=3156917 RepID=UPI003408081F
MFPGVHDDLPYVWPASNRGPQETAPPRAGGADDTETPGQAVLVAGDGPGHETDTGRGSAAGSGTAAGREAPMGGESAAGREPAGGGGTAVGREASMGRESAAGRESAVGGGTAVGRESALGGEFPAGSGTAPGSEPGVGGESVAGRQSVVGRESAVGGSGGQLMPNEECGQLEQRLRHAVAGFVDEPRAAVEEADRAVEELTARFTDAIDRRRRTLRGSWQSAGGDQPGTADTEQLRLALRDYRELADRLLHI